MSKACNSIVRSDEQPIKDVYLAIEGNYSKIFWSRGKRAL